MNTDQGSQFTSLAFITSLSTMRDGHTNKAFSVHPRLAVQSLAVGESNRVGASIEAPDASDPYAAEETRDPAGLRPRRLHENEVLFHSLHRPDHVMTLSP